MGLLLWGVLLLVFCALVQIPAALYLTRYTELREGETPGRDDWEYGHHHPHAHGSTDRERGRCASCGALNDPAFSRCRECATRIGAPGD